jgi:putative ABC transport system permease protein
MQFAPIFRALMHNKSRFWLITLEIALTLAIVVNCVNYMMDLRREYTRPNGLDQENLIVVTAEPFEEEYSSEDLVDAVEQEDIRALNSLQGVHAAAAISAIPISGGGSATGRKVLGSDLDPETTPYFRMRGPALESLGVELIAGRDFEPSDFVYDENGTVERPTERNIIVTQALADVFFPDGNALGGQIQNREGQAVDTIVGIIRQMHNSWPQGWEKAGLVAIYPADTVGSASRMRYMVRAEPGAKESLFATLEPALTAVHGGRIFTVRPHTYYSERHYGDSLVLIKLLTAVIVLLVLVTSFGIVGLTAFSVTQRTRQIGTRRALGANRGDILRYFLVENWMITGIGLAIGLLFTWGLNYALVTFTDAPHLDAKLLVVGVLAIWLSGILAALLPALRATRVSPEIATRTV